VLQYGRCDLIRADDRAIDGARATRRRAMRDLTSTVRRDATRARDDARRETTGDDGRRRERRTANAATRRRGGGRVCRARAIATATRRARRRRTREDAGEK